MPQTLDALISSLDGLLDEFRAAEAERTDVIAAVAEEHRDGAVNLVHYTALRRHDRRELQNDLMDIGVTSLATAEADVWAKVGAARDVLAALRGDAGPWNLDATNKALDLGDEILDANALAILGPTRPDRPTRIMVTFPSEAGSDPALVADLVAAGMDVARVNCAHDQPDTWARMIDNVRSAAAAAGRQVLVEMDLPGPKLRTGPIADGPPVGRARVTRDDTGATTDPARMWFTAAGRPGDPPPPSRPGSRPTLGVEVQPAWLAARAVGDAVAFRDTRGRRRTFVVTEAGPSGALAEGSRSAFLGDGTVLSCRGERTSVSALPAVIRKLSLAPGDQLVLTTDLTPVTLPVDGGVARIGCTLPEAVHAVAPGDAVLIDDGAIDAVVESVGDGEATLRITRTKPGGQHLGGPEGHQRARHRACAGRPYPRRRRAAALHRRARGPGGGLVRSHRG